MAHGIFSKSVVKTAATGLIALGMVASLAACGVRGPLKPPSANTTAQSTIKDPVASEGAVDEPEPQATPTKTVDDDFFLDPLL
ncbi:lipoprotein [uncultured Cohaesibacter sp.]|uniref:lipoprotein n=1 Tax=uncultured Cohaesibacter sp. TaxID=1002546 RepID=UPI002A0A5EC8|nr:lipoprotein [uncultured Cohaesibacter sp.]